MSMGSGRLAGMPPPKSCFNLNNPLGWKSVMLRRWDVRSYTAIVFLISVMYALGMQDMMRSLTPDGMYFHPWSSETMMQTVSLRFLREAPVRTLLSIHIQPPAFDAIRAALALPLRDLSDEAALRRVDGALYSIGAVLVAMLAAVTFRWLAEYGLAAAVLGAILVLLHPASMFFATFLDSTLLSSLLVSAAYFSLWRLKNGRDTSITALSLLVLGLFFTRSIFQWPALLMFASCLYFLGVGQHSLRTFLVTTCLISGLYLAKQAAQFGLFSTTSFSGISLANSIGAGLGTETYTTYLDRDELTTIDDPSLPAVLTSKTKINGEPNFNNLAYLELNRQLLARYENTLRNASFNRLAGSYLENALIYFMPTSTYSGHVIVDHLPWTAIYNAVFSAPVLPILLLAAFLAWAVRAVTSRSMRKSIGMMLPALYILAVCIFSDKGENMRFKFWLEPIMVVFIVSQLHAVAQRLHGTLRRPHTPA